MISFEFCSYNCRSQNFFDGQSCFTTAISWLSNHDPAVQQRSHDPANSWLTMGSMAGMASWGSPKLNPVTIRSQFQAPADAQGLELKSSESSHFCPSIRTGKSVTTTDLKKSPTTTAQLSNPWPPVFRRLVDAKRIPRYVQGGGIRHLGERLKAVSHHGSYS